MGTINLSSQPGAPVVVAGDYISNVASRSGLVAGNGFTPAAGDLVLLTAQSDQTQNGPYIVRASTWDRVISVFTAQSFFVAGGTDAGKTFQLQTASISPASFNSTTGVCGTNLSFVVTSGTAGLPPTFQSGLVTLVAGTKTVTTFNLTSSSRIVATQNTPGGGTQGVKYSIPAGSRSTGSPGSFVINAVDNAGALVNTDTSTLDVIIIN